MKNKEPRYFVMERRQWILEMLRVYGFINRQHIMTKFGLSMPQASLDLKLFQRSYPYFVTYDQSRKCYVRKDR